MSLAVSAWNFVLTDIRKKNIMYFAPSKPTHLKKCHYRGDQSIVLAQKPLLIEETYFLESLRQYLSLAKELDSVIPPLWAPLSICTLDSTRKVPQSLNRLTTRYKNCHPIFTGKRVSHFLKKGIYELISWLIDPLAAPRNREPIFVVDDCSIDLDSWCLL